MLRAVVLGLVALVGAGPVTAQVSAEGGQLISCSLARFNKTRPADETWAPPAQFHIFTMDISASGIQLGRITDPGGFMTGMRFERYALSDDNALTVIFVSDSASNVLQTRGEHGGLRQEAEIIHTVFDGDNEALDSGTSTEGSCMVLGRAPAADVARQDGSSSSMPVDQTDASQ